MILKREEKEILLNNDILKKNNYRVSHLSEDKCQSSSSITNSLLSQQIEEQRGPRATDQPAQKTGAKLTVRKSIRTMKARSVLAVVVRK
ncbi:6582_t:CDS:1, partial [Dentiscutata erythropus]